MLTAEQYRKEAESKAPWETRTFHQLFAAFLELRDRVGELETRLNGSVTTPTPQPLVSNQTT